MLINPSSVDQPSHSHHLHSELADSSCQTSLIHQLHVPDADNTLMTAEEPLVTVRVSLACSHGRISCVS